MPIRDGVFGSVIVLMARELVKKKESEGRLFDIIGQPALVVLLKPETPSPLVQKPETLSPLVQSICISIISCSCNSSCKISVLSST